MECEKCSIRNNYYRVLSKLTLECKDCDLSGVRKNAIFGEGNLEATVMFIGDPPTQEEDDAGLPFVGAEGDLFTSIIEQGMRMKRADVYLTNIIKCRPEMQVITQEQLQCSWRVREQIKIVNPKVIITIGDIATQKFCKTENNIEECHGKWFEWEGFKVMPVYSPKMILKQGLLPEEITKLKTELWADIKQVIAFLAKC